MLSACAIVPAFNAAHTGGDVVASLVRVLAVPVLLVDDGSTDATSDVAKASGAIVVRHARNLGKGAAILTGLREANRRGHEVAVTVDADGQHPAESARRILLASDDARALVLGVRDLLRDGAPSNNRFGNEVSNFFLSRFSGRRLLDTQCGLRRYPVRATLDLGCRAKGYAFEAEVVLRALAGQWPLVELPVPVIYPPANESTSHFQKVRDPVRIIATVVQTLVDLRLHGS